MDMERFPTIPTKGSQLPVSLGVQNMVEKIEVKLSSASQKTENVSTKETAKTSKVDGEGRHSNKTQTEDNEQLPRCPE